MIEYVLADYDVKLVGPEAEVDRFRRYVMMSREALLHLYAGRSDLPDWARLTVEDACPTPARNK